MPIELGSGPFRLREAAGFGITWRQLQSRSFRRVGYGTYVLARVRDSFLLKLAATQCRLPPEAVFSGRTAARLHGLDLGLGGRIDVTVPKNCGISARAGIALHRANLDQAEIVLCQGKRTTSLLRTLLDLGSTLPLTEAVVAVDMALHMRLLRFGDLFSAVQARAGTKYVVALRRVVELAEPAAESPMESRLRLLLVLAGLPAPQVQPSLYDENGTFLARPDLYYPTHRLVIEYDGSSHRDRLVGDNRRHNRLLGAGYRPLRFTSADVLREPDAVVARVRGELAAPRLGAISRHISVRS